MPLPDTTVCRWCHRPRVALKGWGWACPTCDGPIFLRRKDMTMTTFVDSIDENDTGMYRVTTQGSVHTWNLDEGSYIRETADYGNRSMRDFRNGQSQKWYAVEWWPEVGRCFLTRLHGDIPWHRSSTIKSIEKIA